jgi:hypothetical protein
MLKRTIRILLTALARLCIGLFAIAFVISLVAALVLVDAENRLFTSEPYKRALQSTNMVERLPGLLSQEIAAGVAGTDNQQIPGFLQLLTAKDWEVLIRSTLPPDLLQQASEQGLDSVFAYVDGKSGSAEISLLPIKQRLSQKSQDVARQILRAQPPCTLKDLMALVLPNAAGQTPEQVALCNPPPEVTDTFLPAIDPAVQAGIAAIPDTLPLLDRSQAPKLLPLVERARLAMRFSPLVPLVCLLLITLLGVRSSARWLRWWGILLAIGGCLGLLIGALYQPITLALLATQAPSWTSLPDALAKAAQELIVILAYEVALPLMVEAAVLIVVGIGMLALAAGGRSGQTEPKTVPANRA